MCSVSISWMSKWMNMDSETEEKGWDATPGGFQGHFKLTDSGKILEPYCMQVRNSVRVTE